MNSETLSEKEALIMLCWLTADVNGRTVNENEFIKEIVWKMEKMDSALDYGACVAKWEAITEGGDHEHATRRIIETLAEADAAYRVKALAWGFNVAMVTNERNSVLMEDIDFTEQSVLADVANVLGVKWEDVRDKGNDILATLRENDLDYFYDC